MLRFKKKTKKLNNQGSSIIMVIVSLGFVGVIIGALLAAAGYAYKLKLQNKNAKNNFYYVEQAMQEIYAGVGANTIEEMKAAYTYTVENMVRFDPMLGTYVTLDDDVANKMFKKKFMENIQSSEYFAQGDEALAEALEGYITNETVDLDNDKLNLQVTTDANGETTITIKNVTLTRIQDYDQSSGSGKYVQTISTDIVISEPDFTVSFNNIMSDYSEIFEYAMIGDMGVQIVNNNSLEISGNIYASADYYNKAYNANTAAEEPKTFKLEEEVTNVDGSTSTNTLYEYSIAPVTSKDPTSDIVLYAYANKVLADDSTLLKYDGENTYSMNSGLYMSGSNVTIMADRIIVPGTVAVMDSSDLTVFGSAGVISEVWADNIVLGGSSLVEKNSTSADAKITYKGSQAIFGGNLYVKDDTEINAKGAKFTLHGSYYGYGNGTSKDSRTFVPTVDKTNFQILYTVTDVAGNKTEVTENRGHYNTSSIVVNGESSTVDLSEAKKIYIGGRAYIELSKKVEGSTPDDTKYTETFTYIPTEETTLPDGTKKTEYIRDYKTAESISIKSNQMMYNISTLGAAGTITFTSGSFGTSREYDVISLNGKPNAQILFDEFFPKDIFGNNVPYIKATVDGKSVYFIDFDTGYSVLQWAATDTSSTFDLEQHASAQEVLTKYKSLSEYTQAFALAYVDHIEDNDETELRDIIAYDEFEQGTVILPNNEGLPADDPNLSYVYSSGAISTREGTTFTMVTANSATDLDMLLSYNSEYADNYNYVASDNIYGDPVTAFDLSEDLEAEYNYMKWNLNHYDTANKEMEFVEDLVYDMGEDYITPINKYLVMNKVTENITTTTASGYKVYISDNDIVVKDDSNESITGIVISKGDVTFDPSVKHFEGMIVAGGKIYISENLMSLTASPNVCRGILRDCLALGDDTSIKILNVFKEYENYKADDEDGEDGDEDGDEEEVVEVISIDSIDYSQVVSMTNWMKNVGGDYDETHEP